LVRLNKYFFFYMSGFCSELIWQSEWWGLLSLLGFTFFFSDRQLRKRVRGRERLKFSLFLFCHFSLEHAMTTILVWRCRRSYAKMSFPFC
jgi:hypothetical protein